MLCTLIYCLHEDNLVAGERSCDVRRAREKSRTPMCNNKIDDDSNKPTTVTRGCCGGVGEAVQNEHTEQVNVLLAGGAGGKKQYYIYFR